MVRPRNSAELAVIADKLVEDIQQVRLDITARVEHLQKLAMELREVSRRSATEGSREYGTFATAHMRLAGALHLGVRRVGSSDRILREAHVRKTPEALPVSSIARKPIVPDDPFAELYGDYEVGNG